MASATELSGTILSDMAMSAAEAAQQKPTIEAKDVVFDIEIKQQLQELRDRIVRLEAWQRERQQNKEMRKAKEEKHDLAIRDGIVQVLKKNGLVQAKEIPTLLYTMGIKASENRVHKWLIQLHSEKVVVRQFGDHLLTFWRLVSV